MRGRKTGADTKRKPNLALREQREAWEIVVENAVQKQAFPAVLRWLEAGREKCTLTAFPKIWEQYAKSENVPAIMGRIVHLERFVRCLKTKKEQEFKIRLTDSLIPENNGYFLIKTGAGGGSRHPRVTMGGFGQALSNSRLCG